VAKTILYKRTIALGTSIDFRKDLREDLSLQVIVVDLSGGNIISVNDKSQEIIRQY